MRGADILVEMLIAYDVDVVFGVPGDTNVPLYDALRVAQDRLRHVMVRDERSGGYMADAYARISNKPAVMEVPSGAGAMYALPPIAESQYSSVPVILITSDTPVSMEGKGVITELDCAKLFESVTKGSWLVKSANRIPDIVRRAFRVATGGRPGAVHLVVPEDVLLEQVDPQKISIHAEADCKTFPAFPAVAPDSEIEELRDILLAAERPLLIAGGGVNRSMAAATMRRFAERIGIPVVYTITGQASIPDDHPLAIGVIGDNGFHPHASRAVEQADLLIYLGSKIGSVVTVGWTFPSRSAGRRIVQVDIDPTVLGNNTQNALSLCGDIRLVLERLDALTPAGTRVDPSWPALLNSWRADFWKHVQGELNEDTVPLKPQRVVKAFNQRLKRRYNILSDPGTPTPHMTRLLRLQDDGSVFIIPRAFGGLGYALPAVVGAWVAQPDIRPIGLFGDGSFGMNMGELETIARLQCPALLLHFNNACFGWIKALQRLHGHNATYSVDFTALDASKIASCFGIRAWRATNAEELEKALDEAFDHDGPAFIDIVVESIADVVPPVFSWLKRTGHDPLAIPSPKDIQLLDARTPEHH